MSQDSEGIRGRGTRRIVMTGKVIYVSGPMAGMADNNRHAFYSAVQQLQAMGHKVFNPLSHPSNAELAFTYRKALTRDLAWIGDNAEAIVMLPGWRSSAGATVEHALAVALRLEIYFWPGDAKRLGSRGP